jgi:heptosyltransferase III
MIIKKIVIIKRKYCAGRSQLYFLWLKDIFIDFYAQFFYKSKRKDAVISPNPKILIACSGHLGDGLILSYSFAEIKKYYPNATIDVLIGEWCDAMFRQHPLVRKVIHQNHFITNRKPISFLSKLWNHLKTARTAIHELRKEEYDYSIDIRYSGAVSHFLLPFIHVKKAYGFGSRGYGGLLEREFFLPDYEFHIYEMISLLMEQIGIKTSLQSVQPSLPFPKAEISDFIFPNKYVLVFPEAGEPHRMMNEDFWKKLCNQIIKNSDTSIVFCGDKDYAKSLVETLNSPQILLASKLKFSQLATLIQKSALSITMDSFPAHLCPILSPTVVLGKNAAGRHFFPLGNHAVLMIHDNRISRDLTIEREGFRAIYQEKIDEGIFGVIDEFLSHYL